MWSIKSEIGSTTESRIYNHGIDDLPTLQQWIGLASESTREARLHKAVDAYVSLKQVYDTYVDCVEPIYVGVDVVTAQTYFIRKSAKHGFYIASDRVVSFI